MHFDSATVSLAIFLLTQFAVGIWWASKITATIKEVVSTLTDLRLSMREGMFPSCVRHTHQIGQMQKDIGEIKETIAKVHERIDKININGVATRA